MTNRTGAGVLDGPRRRFLLGAASVLLGLVLWQVTAGWIHNLLFPSPAQTWSALSRETASGRLWSHIGASMARIAISWSIGGVAGILLGLLMGSFRPIRSYCEPIIQFLRFIPAIAWITPFTVWWGVGELSKIMLVIYSSTFPVMLSTMAGVFTIPLNRVRAARCFGATPLKIFVQVTLPSAVPEILTGLRLAMGNCFMILVAAEMLASEHGLGFLIFNSRLYVATDLIFLGILSLGVLGLLSDVAFQNVTTRLFKKYLLGAVTPS